MRVLVVLLMLAWAGSATAASVTYTYVGRPLENIETFAPWGTWEDMRAYHAFGANLPTDFDNIVFSFTTEGRLGAGTWEVEATSNFVLVGPVSGPLILETDASGDVLKWAFFGSSNSVLVPFSVYSGFHFELGPDDSLPGNFPVPDGSGGVIWGDAMADSASGWGLDIDHYTEDGYWEQSFATYSASVAEQGKWVIRPTAAAEAPSQVPLPASAALLLTALSLVRVRHARARCP